MSADPTPDYAVLRRVLLDALNGRMPASDFANAILAAWDNDRARAVRAETALREAEAVYGTNVPDVAYAMYEIIAAALAVSSASEAETERGGFIDQPTKREMGVDAPDFGDVIGASEAETERQHRTAAEYADVFIDGKPYHGESLFPDIPASGLSASGETE